MKKINEMTDDEVVSLTEDQLERLVNLACAEEGIPLAPKRPEREQFTILKTDSAFKIKGTDFYFRDQQQAELVASTLSKAHPLKESYDWRIGYDYKWLSPNDSDFLVESAAFFDKLLIEEKEQMLIKHSTLTKEYEKELSLYEKTLEQRRKIADYNYGIFYEAKSKRSKVNELKQIYSEYLTLANADAEQARAFFEKAYKSKVSEDIFKVVLDELGFIGETATNV